VTLTFDLENDFDQTLYIVIPSPTKLRRGYSNASVHPSVKFLVNTLRVNMVQWISTKLGTQVILTEYPLRNFVGEGITMYKVWSKSIEGC
jgi:hypothetical protein